MNISHIKTELLSQADQMSRSLDLALNTLYMHYETFKDSRNASNLGVKLLIDESMESLSSSILRCNFSSNFCSCDGKDSGCSGLFCRDRYSSKLVNELGLIETHMETLLLEQYTKLHDGWLHGIEIESVTDVINTVKSIFYRTVEMMLETLNTELEDDKADILIKKDTGVVPISCDYGVDEEPSEDCNLAISTRFKVHFAEEMGIRPIMVSDVDVMDYASHLIRFVLREVWDVDGGTNCLPYVLKKYMEESIPFNVSVSILDGNLNTRYTEKYTNLQIQSFNRSPMVYGDSSVVTYEVTCDYSDIEYLCENSNY